MGSFDKSYHDLVGKYASITEQQFISRAEAEASIKRRQEELKKQKAAAEEEYKKKLADIQSAETQDVEEKPNRLGPEVLPGLYPFDAILGGETNTYNINAQKAMAARKAMDANKGASAPPPAVKTPTSKSKPAIKAKRPGDTVRPVPVNNPSAGGVSAQPGVANSRFGGLLGTASNIIGRAGDTAQNIASGQMNRGAQRRATSLVPNIKAPPAKKTPYSRSLGAQAARR